MATHTIPYNFTPRHYQLPVFRAMQGGIRRAVLCWHRRAGKEKTCLNLMITLMAEKEAEGIIGTYYYFFPTFAQGKKALWDAIGKDGFRFIDHFPKDFVRKTSDSEMQVVTRNGSVFQIIGTENIDSMMSTNALGCVFSEYALQRSEAWNFIRPILAENGGWAIFNFTPRGRNHAWQLLQTAQADPEWFWQVLTVEDTGAIAQKELERERKEMPLDLYEQEYLCKFSDGAGQFFKNVEACVWDENHVPHSGTHYQAGIDLAKVNDYTVLTVIDLATHDVGKQQRFNQMDYTMQKEKIIAFYEYWNRPKTYIDKTGIGEPIYDFLRGAGVHRLVPFQFTAQSRNDLLLNLALELEKQSIRIPNDEALLNELRAFRHNLDDNGQTRIIGTQGVHDDMVMSLALAVRNLPKPPAPPKEPDPAKEILSQFDAIKGNRKALRTALWREYLCREGIIDAVGRRVSAGVERGF